MRIVVFDYSDAKNFKKNRKILGKCLFNIADKNWFGNIPMRVIYQLIKQLKKIASKNTKIIILVADRTSPLKWSVYEIGSKNSESNPMFLYSRKFDT